MTSAILDLDREQVGLLEHCGFRQFSVLVPLDGGMFSRPLLVEADGGRYLLRTHTFRPSPDAFRFQAETLAWVASQGIGCAQVIRLVDGSWCRALSGARGVLALHEFVEGSVDAWLPWHMRKESAPGWLAGLGRLVAQLHNALRKAPSAGDPRLAVDLPPIQLDRLEEVRRCWNIALDHLRDQAHKNPAQASATAEVLFQLRPRIDEHWQRLSAAIEPRIARLPRQVVHGDVSPVNLVLGSAGAWSFIDWDCVHVGYRAYDAMGDILNRPPGECPELNRFRHDHVGAYLNGYQAEIRPSLTEDELRLVPAFCLARQLEDLRQRVRALPNLRDWQDEEYAALIRRRVEMMDQIPLD